MTFSSVAHYYPFIAPCLGLGLGCVINTAVNRSLYKTQKIHPLGQLGMMSNVCETTRFKAHSIQGLLGKTFSIDVIPLLVASAEEMVKLFLKFPLDGKSNFSTGGKFFVFVAKHSFLTTVPFLLFSLEIVMAVKDGSARLKKKNIHTIDPSGHAITVLLNAYLRLNTLSALNAFGVRSYTYTAYVGIASLFEGVWVYDTSVNFHSTADMIGGVAIGGLALLAHSRVNAIFQNIYNNYLVKRIFV